MSAREWEEALPMRPPLWIGAAGAAVGTVIGCVVAAVTGWMLAVPLLALVGTGAREWSLSRRVHVAVTADSVEMTASGGEVKRAPLSDVTRVDVEWSPGAATFVVSTLHGRLRSKPVILGVRGTNASSIVQLQDDLARATGTPPPFE